MPTALLNRIEVYCLLILNVWFLVYNPMFAVYIKVSLHTVYTYTHAHTFIHVHVSGVLNWRYDAIHGARECQRASIFFPAPL